MQYRNRSVQIACIYFGEKKPFSAVHTVWWVLQNIGVLAEFHK